MKATIDGVAVHSGELRQRERNGLKEITGIMKVGDNDAPRLVQAMTSDRELLYIGPVSTADGVKTMTLPVLIKVRMGTAATVVEVQSAGAPRET